jgi:cytochrome c-type biogenesis protein CcmE
MNTFKKKLVLVTSLAVVGLTAPVATALGPTHLKASFTINDNGPLCDFNYLASFTVESNVIVFGDVNDPTKVIAHESVVETHTNLDTGASLSEVDHFTIESNAETERFKQVGLTFHLRDASGKLLAVNAGQTLFDTSTGELLKVTPNHDQDFAAVICHALGGNPL